MGTVSDPIRSLVWIVLNEVHDELKPENKDISPKK
jgi:hypothetical protein